MDIIDWIHDLTWADLPPAVREQARRCLLDTLGVAATGRQTDTAAIVYDFAAAAYGGQDTRLWFDGRPVSAPGAALAHGMMIDAFDMHDTCRPVKGHAGVALVPAALATLGGGDRPVSGKELLTTLVMGYEVAIRAGLALHATACDYHTSGAWNALGCAAMVARRLGLDREQTRHALGIAEYHGPRSQMMRCIDFPTMVKDGSGWGAMAGVSAGLLAAAGFTGAPAITVEGSAGEGSAGFQPAGRQDAGAPLDGVVREIWADTGREWKILVQYFKPYAVCYWAQAPIAGALKLQREYGLAVSDIALIRVYTFHEATRLACRRPETTDEAQYSLPFPVAAALVRGQVGLAELSGAGLRDPAVLALVDKVAMVEEQRFNDRFPAERLARVEIETVTGRVFDSGEVRPLWDLSSPPSDEALREKFRQLTGPYMSPERTTALETAAWHCADLTSAAVLLNLLTSEPGHKMSPSKSEPA